MTIKKTPPLCVDCAFHRRTWRTMGDHMCAHPFADARNVVDGGAHAMCLGCRDNGNKCGDEGRWWKSKTER